MPGAFDNFMAKVTRSPYWMGGPTAVWRAPDGTPQTLAHLDPGVANLIWLVLPDPLPKPYDLRTNSLAVWVLGNARRYHFAGGDSLADVAQCFTLEQFSLLPTPRPDMFATLVAAARLKVSHANA